MIYNEDTYYIGYHKNVREIGALPAVTFDTICGLLREDGIGEISNSTLCDILGVTPQGLRKIVSRLIEADYIKIVRGIGRGNTSTYEITEKGKQCCRLFTNKRETTFPKKGNNVSLKGKQSYPIKEELKKELKEKEETPTPVVMEKEFLEFWDKMLFSPDWDYDKENCARVWDGMPSEWRTKLVTMAQNGLRWRTKENDKPIFYLRDYRGQDVNMELPFVRNGSAQIDHWQRDGKTICVMMYEGRVAYCLAENRPTMESAGAQYLRDF